MEFFTRARTRRTLLRQIAAATAGMAITGGPASAGTAGLPRRAPASLDSRVVVIGAGLAGLSAALELSRAGHHVTVLEARDRPGGRVCTARGAFPAPLASELGAVVFSGAYVAANEYINEFALKRRPYVAPDLPALYHVGGERRAVAAGESLAGLYALTPQEAKKGPVGLVLDYLVKPLPAGALDATAWPSPALRELDRVSLADFLRSNGASEGAVKLISDALYFGWDPENASTLSIAVTDIGLFFKGDPMFVLEGGNSSLPEAMAAVLGDAIEYGTEVTRVEPSEAGVRMITRTDAGVRAFDADRVVVALPVGVVPGIDFAGGLPRPVARALEHLPQHDILRVQYQVNSAYWRNEGVSGAVVTDLFGGRIDRQPYDDVGTAGRPAILDAMVVGADARHLATLDDEALLRAMAARVNKAQPGLEAHLEGTVIRRWVTDPYTRGGWSWPAPGFVSEHLAALQASYGRLHFAGEHTDLLRASMEGALQSGRRAAAQIDSAAGVAGQFG